MKRTLLSFCLVSCVFIIAQAQVTPNFINTQTCYGNQTTFVASSSLPDNSISMWQWDLDGDGTYEMSGKTIISLFTLNDTNAVMLKITPISGAPDSITKNVIIDPLPDVNFMANNLCELKAATYISLSTISSGSINQYLWDFNNDNVTDDNFSGDTAMYTCGPAQIYDTKLICVSDKGCSAFTQKNTIVYPNPTAAFSTSNACVNANATFTNNTDTTNINIAFFLWNFGDGNGNTTSNPTHTYTTAGTYAVDLIAVSLEGCRDTASSSITINPLPMVVITPGGPTVFCVGGTVMLDAGIGFSSYLWSNSSNAQSIAVSSSGNYNITATDANGCSNMNSITVTANLLPMVSITASDTILHPGSSMILIADGASSYSWSTGSYSNNITITQSGTYKVLGTDANGCAAWDSIVVMNENPDDVYVSSNIMTPNGDGINEYLVIESIDNYANCDLTVYNMWNDEVYSVSGYKNDWGGYGNNGKQVPDGPYYYIIACDDKPVLKGNINIILR